MILIKQCNSIQLAHLYEHLFCAQIDDLFYDNNLFPYLDYSVIGRTYHRGVIYIDVLTYSPEATSLAKEISVLDVEFDKESVTIAVSQLVAEKEHNFKSLGYEVLKQELHKLHTQPWQDLDDLELVDTKKMRRKANVALHITKDKPLKARKLTTNIILDPHFAVSHRELLPLYRQIALLINANLQSSLADNYGYYSFENKYINSSRAIYLSNIFKVASSQQADVVNVIKVCLEDVANLKAESAFNRLAASLLDVSHTARPDLMPNPESNFEDTLIFIGAKGWKKIATEENCHSLLQHMAFEVRYGRNVIKQPMLPR